MSHGPPSTYQHESLAFDFHCWIVLFRLSVYNFGALGYMANDIFSDGVPVKRVSPSFWVVVVVGALEAGFGSFCCDI